MDILGATIARVTSAIGASGTRPAHRWDGTGYRRKLKGEAIPLAARLFAVVDVWDALRSDRPYRQGWPDEQVIAHLRAGVGCHFEPQAVEAFLKLLAVSESQPTGETSEAW